MKTTECKYDCVELGTHRDCDLHMDRAEPLAASYNSTYYRDQINQLLEYLQACTVGRYATDVVSVESMKVYLKEILDNAPKD